MLLTNNYCLNREVCVFKDLFILENKVRRYGMRGHGWENKMYVFIMKTKHFRLCYFLFLTKLPVHVMHYQFHIDHDLLPAIVLVTLSHVTFTSCSCVAGTVQLF